MIELGQRAPAFRLPDTNGTPIALGDLGAPTLVVFLPAAFTPICTGELGALRAVGPRIAATGARVLGISCDSVFALRTWVEQEGLEDGPEGLRVLSDFWPHGEVSRAYDAFDDGWGTSTRTSYLLDADGVVRWSAQTSSGVARDLEEHAAAVEQLTAPAG